MHNAYRKTLLLLISALLFSVSVSAQFLDTLKYSLHQHPKPYASLDYSQALGANHGTDVIGFRLGVVQNKRLYMGLGYYPLNTDKVNNITVQTANETDTVVPAQLKLRFLTLNVEYVFYRDRKFQMGAHESGLWQQLLSILYQRRSESKNNTQRFSYCNNRC